MTCQHHCQAQCHSALLATKMSHGLQQIIKRKKSVKQSSSFGDFCFDFIYLYLLISLFELSNDHLRSRQSSSSLSYLSAFLQPKMLGVSKHKASVYTVCFLEIKDARDCKQVERMTQGAKCFLNIRWLLLPSILHPRPNLPTTA